MLKPYNNKGGLYLGSGSMALATLTVILSQTQEMGEFASVLAGPMGVIIGALLSIISISAFIFHTLVNPLRKENIGLKEEITEVRNFLVKERERLREKYEEEMRNIREEMRLMQNKITKLSSDLAAANATLEALKGAKARRPKKN